MPSLIVMAAWRNLGFAMVLFLAGLQTIPVQLYEAASIDGAGRWAAFKSVTLPLLRPTLLFAVVITTIGYLQVFEEPFVMTDGGPLDRTLSVSMFMYEEGFEFFHQGYAAAIAWVLFLLVAIVAVVQFRLLAVADMTEAPAMTALTRAAPPHDAAAGAPQRSRASIVLYVLLTLGIVAMVAPFVWMVLGSFKPQGEFLRLPPTWLPEAPTHDNYQRLIDQLDMPRFFFNSIVVAVVVTVGNLDLRADARLRPGQAPVLRQGRADGARARHVDAAGRRHPRARCSC